MSSACVGCLNIACVRIRLRNCTHVSCIACILTHLQHFIHLKAKVVIRCLDTNCTAEIHENDINAALDPNEDGLDVFMSREERQFLQYCHNKDSIILAIAGPNSQNQELLIRRCPLCKTIYTKYPGCHNVICANSSCKTRFCWKCGKPITGFRHFTVNHECVLGSKDVDRGLFLLRFLKEVSPCALLLGIPIVCMFFIVLFPIMIVILFPLTHTLNTLKKGHERYSYLTRSEKIMVGVKVMIGLLLLIPVSLIVALLSFPSACGLLLLYLFITLLKNSPCTRKLFDHYDRLLPGCFGLGHYKKMLKESRDEQVDEERNMIDVERVRIKQAPSQ